LDFEKGPNTDKDLEAVRIELQAALEQLQSARTDMQAARSDLNTCRQEMRTAYKPIACTDNSGESKKLFSIIQPQRSDQGDPVDHSHGSFGEPHVRDPTDVQWRKELDAVQKFLTERIEDLRSRCTRLEELWHTRSPPSLVEIPFPELTPTHQTTTEDQITGCRIRQVGSSTIEKNMQVLQEVAEEHGLPLTTPTSTSTLFDKEERYNTKSSYDHEEMSTPRFVEHFPPRPHPISNWPPSREHMSSPRTTKDAKVRAQQRFPFDVSEGLARSRRNCVGEDGRQHGVCNMEWTCLSR